MAFLWNHQMFLQVFSKKVCFCCILGCFAEKKLPQMSQILTDGACLEFCEFCVLWEYSSPTDCTDQHRWLVALVVAWVWQGCHTLLHLCKSVLSVGTPSLQEASVQICEICGRKSQQEGSVNSVNSVGGNHSEKALWILWNLWEEIAARRLEWNLWENCFGCVGSTLLQNRQAEDVLPRISQILTDGACLEFYEFCVCGNTVLPRIALINTDGWLR